MKLAVVIPNFSKNESSVKMLARALDRLRHFEPSLFGQHVIVVDDGSPMEGCADRLRELQKDFKFKLMLQDENAGYSRAINAGIWLAEHHGYTHVITINTDVEVTAPFTEFLMTCFQDEQIGVVGGLLLYPSGRIQSAGFEVNECGQAFEYDKAKRFQGDEHQASQARYVMGVTGAFQAFDLSLGGYVDRHTLGYEDIEFCLRAWSQGRRVLYAPIMQAIHSESATRGRFPSQLEVASFDNFMRYDMPAFNLSEIAQRVADANHSST